jgi:anti-sigma factor (TIGR02949 family)
MSKKLRCEDVIKQLYAYLDQEVGASTKIDIDHHLEQCRECYSRAEFEKRLRNRVSETAEAEAPEQLRDRIKELMNKF